MNRNEIMGRAEMEANKIAALARAIEDACPLYTTDENVTSALDRLLALVSVLQDQAKALKTDMDVLEVIG